MALIMQRWGKTAGGHPQWRIGTEDCAPVTFPSDARIITLFRETMLVSGDLTIISRQSDSFIIEAPFSITEYDRTPFLRALWKETHFT